MATNTATAATYYVDAYDSNGNDDANGLDWSHAWKTLGKTKSTVKSGDTVIFKNGSYGSYSEIDVNRTGWVTYIAATGHHPEIEEIRINSQVYPRDTYLIFDGFTIRPTYPCTITADAAVELLRSRHTQFKNLNIIGMGGKYVNMGFLIRFASGDILIDKCVISGGEKTGRYDGFNTAIYAYDSNNLVITNNDIKQFCYNGIAVSSRNVNVSNNDIHYFGGDAGIIINPGVDGILIENNSVHDLVYYQPVLSEDPHTTTWSADGMTMTNPSATWEVNEPQNWTGLMMVVATSGTNVKTGYANAGYVSTVTNPTEMHLFASNMKLDPNGPPPSDVNYYIIEKNHGDLIQVLAYGITSNLTVRGNKFYDWDGQLAFINPVNSGEPNSRGGHNFLFENNLFYSHFTSGQGEIGIAVGLHYIEGLVFRNNTIFTSLPAAVSQCGNVTFVNNIINYVSIANTAGLSKGDYNIYNRGFITSPYSPGPHDIFFYPNSYSWDKWNSPAFTGIFADYANGDFRLASAASLGVGHGDPENYPATDILGNSRDSSPDAGCYEYVGSVPPPSGNSPNADAGQDQTLTDTDLNGSEQVTLDGSGSNDPDGSIVSYIWTEDGSQIATGVGPIAIVSLPIGQHTITLQVTDNDALTDTDTVIIKVGSVPVLVGHWKFDEGTGTVANDFSGSGAAGDLINGPTWTTQGEISFDGSDDAVEISTANLNADEGAIALWAYPNAFSKSRHFLFGHILSGSNRIQLYCNALGTLCVGLGDNAGLSTNIQTLNVHEWYHIALVWNGTNYVVYVDGVQKATGTYSGLSGLQTYADIGNNGNSSGRAEGFDGLIDEVRLYNKPLAASEIADLALVFLPIGDKSVAEGEELRFSIRAKSGSIVELSDPNLPSLPYLALNTFSWTPDYDDAGTYELEFTALHDSGEDFEKVTVSVIDTQQDDLVGYWTFNETSGDIAADSSATGNTGYLKNGLSWDSGKINGALVFSVPNDAVEIPTTNFDPKTGTIAMWVYVERQTLSRHYLFGHATESMANRIQLYLKYGNLCLGLGNSHETHTNIQQLQNQKWYHIALTWSPTTYSMYVDGLLKASGVYPGLTGLADHADIGNNGISRDKALNGKIDDVRIYNRVLGTAEIAQLAVGN